MSSDGIGLDVRVLRDGERKVMDWFKGGYWMALCAGVKGG